MTNPQIVSWLRDYSRVFQDNPNIPMDHVVFHLRSLADRIEAEDEDKRELDMAWFGIQLRRMSKDLHALTSR